MDEVAQQPAVGEPPDFHRPADAARRERSRVGAERDLPELPGEACERVLEAGAESRLGGGPGYGKDREERRPDPDPVASSLHYRLGVVTIHPASIGPGSS